MTQIDEATTTQDTSLAHTPQAQAINLNSDGQIITTEEAISAIVNAEGDIELAAEMLFGPAPPLRQRLPGQLPNKSRLIAILARDVNAFHVLQRQLRVLTLVSTFTMSREIDVVLSSMLSGGMLAATDLVRLKNTVTTNLVTLTDDKTSVVEHRDSREALMDELPASVREAMKVVMLGSEPHTSTPASDYDATPISNSTAQEPQASYDVLEQQLRPTWPRPRHPVPPTQPPPLRSFTDDNGSGFSPITGTPHTSYR